MYTSSNKPKGYKPYKKLTVLSNVLSGGGSIVESDGFTILLIGKGTIPKVWLYRVERTDDNEVKVIPVVEDSISAKEVVARKDGIDIEQDICQVHAKKGWLSIMLRGELILELNDERDDAAIIDHLDLRPIGFKIHGEDDCINVYGSTFRNSSSEGSNTIIALN